MGVYYVPYAPRRRALNPATGEGCQGQELPRLARKTPKGAQAGDAHVFVTGQR